MLCFKLRSSELLRGPGKNMLWRFVGTCLHLQGDQVWFVNLLKKLGVNVCPSDYKGVRIVVNQNYIKGRWIDPIPGQWELSVSKLLLLLTWKPVEFFTMNCEKKEICQVYLTSARSEKRKPFFSITTWLTGTIGWVIWLSGKKHKLTSFHSFHK